MAYSRYATVYNPAWGNSSNGGVTSRASLLCVAGMKLAPEEWNDKSVKRAQACDPDTVIFDVAEKHIGGSVYRYLKPREMPEGVCGPMNGGAIAECDGEYLPVHDRFETWEEYNRNSR